MFDIWIYTKTIHNTAVLKERQQHTSLHIDMNMIEGDERERRSPLPEIIRSSYPH